MAAGGLVIWSAVMCVLLHAARPGRSPLGETGARRLIVWGGAVFPSATLLILLAYALWLMPGLRPAALAAGEEPLRIEVTGKQFWWRVAYHLDDGTSVISANEIRLPVGQRVELTLNSADVIHSFWIPALGGKMDMVPGRTNRLSLVATKAGNYRGPCAEFCGPSHALMAFSAVAMEPGGFRSWLAQQAAPSDASEGDGIDLFMKHGCASCHRINGTEAQGLIGPDLSHIGSRETIGAGILPNTAAAIARFISEPDVIKPGSKMPAFRMLPPEDIRAIATYLKGLE
ncbi:c-type cytochrome [Mesorhizobium sp. M0488]|uniref:cytochrome c oxidase subunit II n=1 Tax=unclassified Mesorhizobium TaxID=325217 RepID=UPI0033369A94